MAGKAHKFSGHVFFDDLVSATRIDRGQVRQLCAEMAMLLFEDATNNNWRDLGASDLDDYYYKQLGFNNSGGDALRFRTILDKSYDLMGNRKIKKLKGHEAIHLFLLIAQLQKGYTRSWESKLVDAFENFRAECANAKYNKEGEFWSKYVQWTMTSAHSKSSLSSRHNFFIQKMYNKLSPQSLDTNRIYGELERDIIYYKANKKCAVCDELINWPELEIHHVTEYQHGGQTVLKNGVAVHKSCHPKGTEASEFEKRYFGNKP